MSDPSGGMANVLALIAVTALGAMLFAPAVAASPDLGWVQSYAAQSYEPATSGHGDLSRPAPVYGDLGVTPGVRAFDSSARSTGAIVLDYEGVPDVEIAFQTGSTQSTQSRAYVDGVNGGATMPVPEPATILLLGSGLIGLGAARKRFKRA